VARPWQDILPASTIETILSDAQIRYRNWLYTLMVTIWAMVYQVLGADKSLSHTVKWLRKWLLLAGETAPASDTGGYSKARTRLPEIVLERLVGESGAALAQGVSSAHRWCGRPVKVFDGSTVLMSDSVANQKAYPQHGNQQPGCGFPSARIVVFFH
jgi:hypothetical protein